MSINERSEGETASCDALRDDAEDGEDVSPLLALEPTDFEKPAENPCQTKDSNQSPRLAPLLGTSTSEIVENAGKSSSGRSPTRACYSSLLQDGERLSPANSQKTVSNAAHRRQGRGGCLRHSQ